MMRNKLFLLKVAMLFLLHIAYRIAWIGQTTGERVYMISPLFLCLYIMNTRTLYIRRSHLFNSISKFYRVLRGLKSLKRPNKTRGLTRGLVERSSRAILSFFPSAIFIRRARSNKRTRLFSLRVRSNNDGETFKTETF